MSNPIDTAFRVPAKPPKSHFYPHKDQLTRRTQLELRSIGRRLLRVAPDLDDVRYRPLLTLFSIRYQRYLKLVTRLDMLLDQGAQLENCDSLLIQISRIEEGLGKALAGMGLTPTTAQNVLRERIVDDFEIARQEAEDADTT